LDFWMYRFMNRKTIFEQMKSSGSLRYIQNKGNLNAILQYEEHAGENAHIDPLIAFQIDHPKLLFS